MLEVVASHDLWIWHTSFVLGVRITISMFISLFDDILDDATPIALFKVNGAGFEKGYYLADDVYPQWATFVKSFTVAQDEKRGYFERRQESARNDVERAFDVL